LQGSKFRTTMLHTGRCLCGGSTVTVDADPQFNAICHCDDCRRCNGTAFSTQVIVPATSAKVEGSYKTFEVKLPNKHTTTRWFCTGCGSQLMHRSEATGDDLCVQTGNIDEFTKLPIAIEVFSKDRWPCIKPIEGAQQFECMPPLVTK